MSTEVAKFALLILAAIYLTHILSTGERHIVDERPADTAWKVVR